jgi:macrolide transport system ATP-binding/permease protein
MKFLKRLARLLRRSPIDQEINDELLSHLEMRTADNIADGMTVLEARRAARLHFGNPLVLKEKVQSVDLALGVGDFVADLRYALRGCLKNPGFTALAALTLSLGICVNATFFAAYNGVALKPLPVRDAHGLFRVQQYLASGTTGDAQFFFSWPQYSDYRDHCRSLSDVIAASRLIPVPANLPGDAANTATTLHAQIVSANYFPSLVKGSAAGRLFLTHENEPGAEPVLVLSYPFWQRTLQGDSSIVGKTMKVNGTFATIAGVAPREFIGTGAPPLVPDFWAPISMQPDIAPGGAWVQEPDNAQFQLLARLETGIDRSQAESELLLSDQHWRNARHFEDKTIAVSLWPATFFGDTNALWFRGVIVLLMAVIGLVLLIVCANLTNMLMARGNMRRHEIAVRRALGASRTRLLRQLLTEYLLLALIGGGLGLLLSIWTSRLLQLTLTRMVESLPMLGGVAFTLPLSPDYRVVVYTLLLSLLTAMVFGLYPALQFSRTDAGSALKDEAATSGQQVSRSRLRNFLVGSQFAVSLFLLICAGLLIQGLRRSLSVDPGFETRRVFTAALNVGPKPSQTFQRRIMDRLRSSPSVASVAISFKAPGTGTFTRPLIVEGSRGSQEVLSGGSLGTIVSPDYFRTMSVPILRGRIFTEQEAETSAPVTVMSEASTRMFWPHEDPIGQRIKLDLKGDNTWREYQVIGIARDARNTNLTRIDPTFFYLPAASNSFVGATILIRLQGDPRQSARAVADSINEMDRTLQPSLVSLEDGQIRIQRLLTEMLGSFVAVLAVLVLPLAAAGIYGVIAFLVSQRIREIGIRMALGATRADVLRLILSQGMRPVVFGASLGLLLSLGASTAVHAFLAFPGVPDVLFGVSFFDPLSFVGLTCFLGCVALLASFIPARRAMRVDPMVALRYE